MSKLTELKEAVNIIWETIRIAEEQENSISHPYFFIVGAGISAPEIPLAGGIIEHCKKKAKSFCNSKTEENELVSRGDVYSEKSAKYYSYWFGTAYKNKIQRQQYLKEIINTARISTSNLLLAQILNSKKIATSVVTPNFDNHLQKSMNLMGNYEVFSTNNVADNMAIIPDSSEIQIMHVHGTYQFYDCKNLDKEILGVANQQGIKSTARTIEEFLKNQVPIVIGYSGWEDDVLMTSLQKRLSCADLPYNLIWFCYSRRDYESLPGWLKDSDDVVFVCPPEPAKKETVVESEIKLSAEEVLSALINKFSINAPFIFTNPIKYYIDVVDRFLPQNMDLFPVEAWKRRLDNLEEHLSEIDKQIIELEEVAARKDIRTVTHILGQINTNFLTPEDVNHIMNGVVKQFITTNNCIDDEVVVTNFIKLVISIIYIKKDEITREYAIDYIDRVAGFISRHDGIIQKDCMIVLLDELLRICESLSLVSMILMITGIKSEYVESTQKAELLHMIVDEGKQRLEDIDIARSVLHAIHNITIVFNEMDEEYYEIMRRIVKRYDSDKNILERYYFTLVEWCRVKDRCSFLDIESVINEIETKDVSPRILLHAKKVRCELEENSPRRIEIAKGIIDEYNLNDISSCMECQDYTYILGRVLSSNQEVPHQVEKRYIDKAFELCEKEHYCKLIIGSITTTIDSFIKNTENEYEKRALIEHLVKLYKYLVESCEKNESFEDYDMYLTDLFNYLTAEEKEQYMLSHSRSFKVNEANNKMMNAINCYKHHDIEQCKKLLLEASEEYDIIYKDQYNPALLNISYMVRRGEMPEIKANPMDLLNRITLWKNAFWLINKALVYVQQKEWGIAQRCIEEIEYSLEEAINWWRDEEIVGKYEKYVVICLLLLANKLSDYESIISDDFLIYCRDEIAVPGDIYSQLESICK